MTRFALIAFAAILAASNTLHPAAAAPPSTSRPTPVEVRVDTLFKQLTEAEKLSLLTGAGFTTQPIPRLGIPAMGMVDGPRGVRGGIAENNGPATQFLEPIAMAATWNPELIGKVGAAMGEEAQDKGAGAQVLLGPCVNIERSPLWGRSGESFGEDPWLASRMAVDYIEGVQSTGAAACIKHFACNNEEIDRDYVNALVNERALREIYLPAFEAGIKEGRAWTLMAAYNCINGYHATANKYLLTKILRNEWGFDGIAMSDWGAVHKTTEVVNAGLDLEMPGGEYLTRSNLAEALHAGRISQTDIDAAVKRILRTIIRVGLMDGKKAPDHAKVDMPAHRQANFAAASEAMVLMKNDHDALPLSRKSIHSIAVIGPVADAVNYGIGGSSFVSPTYFVTPYAGIKKAAGPGIDIRYAMGAGISGTANRLPTVIPESAFAPAHGSAGEHGLTGEYFANDHLGGTPAFVRTDSDIDFDWTSAPAAFIPREHFSVRWTGMLTPPKTGRYVFGVNADDGVRVFIDDRPIIDHWADGAATQSYGGEIDLVAGRAYNIRIEYYQAAGDASIRLAWLLPGERVPGIDEAAALAARSDAAVVFVGTDGSIESEGFDRSSMALPGNQADLIEAVTAANESTIVVVNSGGPCAMAGWIGKTAAVIQSWNAGQETGNAIAGILFGDINPSGKLPTTFGVRREDYPDYGHFPGVSGHVKYAEGIFVGYRHFDHAGIAPLFPFGYGLSYTIFRYHDLHLSASRMGADGHVDVSLAVTNDGKRAGKEVVELYVHDPAPKLPKPVRELKGFRKVDLLPGQTKTVTFILTPSSLAYCDVPHKSWRADAGEYEVQIGSSSRDIKLRGLVHLTALWTRRVPGMGNGPITIDEGYAGGRPATSSSTEGDLSPANAVDGDPSTRWGSQFSDPQWIAVDLGQVRTVGHVRLTWEDAFAKAYQVQVLTDDHSWRTVYSTEDSHGGVENIRFAPARARVVRIYCTKRATQWGDSLFSFGVFGK